LDFPGGVLNIKKEQSPMDTCRYDATRNGDALLFVLPFFIAVSAVAGSRFKFAVSRPYSAIIS
jgi:hypothetical protein